MTSIDVHRVSHLKLSAPHKLGSGGSWVRTLTITTLDHDGRKGTVEVTVYAEAREILKLA